MDDHLYLAIADDIHYQPGKEDTTVTCSMKLLSIVNFLYGQSHPPPLPSPPPDRPLWEQRDYCDDAVAVRPEEKALLAKPAMQPKQQKRAASQDDEDETNLPSPTSVLTATHRPPRHDLPAAYDNVRTARKPRVIGDALSLDWQYHGVLAHW